MAKKVYNVGDTATYSKVDKVYVVNSEGGSGSGGGMTPHNHDDRYYTKEQIDGSINHVAETLQGRVKTNESDTPDFLVNKVDNVTLSVEGNELKVKSVDGMHVGVAQLNAWLSGTNGNIQNQIDGILGTLTAMSSGMRYRGKLETHAELVGIGNSENGDLAVVLADETRDGARSLYVYNEPLGYWDFVGAFEFSDEFIALSDTPSSYAGADGKYVRVDETNGKLVFADVDYGDLANKPASTITQIDDAVAKRHDHSNKPALDRIGIIEHDGEKILTIDGIQYIPKRKKEILSAYLSSAITFNANDYIKWNVVKPLSTIPYDPDTGLFTLTPGKSYKVFVSVMGEISNYITIHFARGLEKVRSNPRSVVYGATTVNNRGGSGVLVTTFTIGESSEGKYGILVGEIGDKESVRLFDNRTMLYIEEITDI